MSIHKKVLVGVTLMIAAILAPQAYAAGDAERGEVLADTCLGCHGIPGYRNAYPSYRVPKLGGQHQEYLVIALNGYKSGQRQHLTMQAQMASLSDQDIADLAAYFAALGEPVQGAAAAENAAGAEKATVCAACHGPNGVSTSPNWPVLAGQHQDYLQTALAQYAAGDRKDPVMAGQVTNLTAEDIADLAAYFAAQSGLFSIK